MFYLLALLMCLAPSTVHAMLNYTNGTQLIHRTPHALPISGRALHGPSVPQSSLPRKALSPHDPVFQAAQRGDMQAIKAHFESWRYTLLSRDYYHQAIVEVLEHAVKFAPEKTSRIIEYLIPKVALDCILRPETLLESALQNNHPAIIKYVAASSDKSIDHMLHQAFSDLGDAQQTDQLSSIERIKNLFGAIPTDQHETELRKYLPLAPAHLRTLITFAVQQHLYPPRIYMVEDSSIGIASTDDYSNDEDDKLAFDRAWQEYANMSPLQQAALAKDHKRCLALLTEFKEPILQNEKFPLEALKIIQDPQHKQAAASFNTAPREYQDALRTMSAFTVNMRKRLDKQFALAKTLRTAVDPKGRTALDIARALKAPAALLQLLDPNNNLPIQEVVGAHLQSQFMNSIPRAQIQLSGEQLKVGDEVIINGIKYIVTDANKLN